MSDHQEGILSLDRRKLLAALFGVVVAVFSLVLTNVWANHAPRPHELPVGVVGAPAVASGVAGQLDRVALDGYQVHRYPTLTAARAAVLNRKVYGAFQPAPSPVLVVASAGGPALESLLQRTFGSPPFRSTEPLMVQDVAPLPSSDPTGGTAFSSLLSLILAGIMGSTVIFTLTRNRPMMVHLAAFVGLAIAAGLATALVTNVVVAAFPGHFLDVRWISALFILAIGVPIAASQELFGIAGLGLGYVMFLVIGNPAAGGSGAFAAPADVLPGAQPGPAAGCRRHPAP